MKYNRLISVFLVISILFNAFCPISLAAYQYGSGNSSHSIEWQELAHGTFNTQEYDGNRGTITYKHSKLETVEITVTESGIYNVSHKFGGDVVGQYVIAGKMADNTLAPLPVAVYGNEDGSAISSSNSNSSSDRTTSVYLEAGKTYYVSFVSKDGKSIHDDKPTESSTVTLNVKYVEPAEGEIPYETDISSLKYTAPTASKPDSKRLWGIGTSSSSNPIVINHEAICTNPNLQSISGDKLNLSSDSAVDEEQDAAWYEKIITWFVLGLCDGIRAILRAIFNEDMSIDKILFNQYSSIRLSFFDSDRVGAEKNTYLEGSGMLDSDDGEGVITKYFMLFRNIAIAVYIVMLLYMGVRILLSSTGKSKSKYMSMMTDWVKGIIILVLFPYVMKYSIAINDAIVDYVAGLKEDLKDKGIVEIQLPELTQVSATLAEEMNLANSSTAAASNGDFMEVMRVTASKTGRVAYAMIYLFLLKQLITFIYIYFKRLISVTFLIVIFPLVTISYAVDKIGDGKSDAFNNWFKEFILNVFMQAFQAVNYILIMSIIFALTKGGGTVNIILVLIAFEYISKGDELLRGMFSKMSGGGAGTAPKSLSDAAKTMITVSTVSDLAKKVGATGKRITNFTHSIGNVRDSYNNYVDARIKEREEQKNVADANWAVSALNPDNDASSNISVALNHLGANDPEKVKKALDNLYNMQNDPALADRFEHAYASLSDTDKEKLDKLMEANRAINETIKGDVGINGALVNREINVNAKLILDVVNGGNAGLYKDLYGYIDSRQLSDGSDLKGALERSARARTLSNRQQQQFARVQSFLGNVTNLDTSANGENRPGVAARQTPLASHNMTDSTRQEIGKIKRKYGTQGASQEVEAKQERAATVVARMKSFKFKMDQGTAEGCSVEEAMELVKEYRALSADSDAGVQNILAQIGDEAADRARIARTEGVSEASVDKSRYRKEANVGFTMQQFESMTAVAVMQNKDKLRGTDEEREAMINEAGKIIMEVSTGKRYTEDASGNMQEHDVDTDKVTRAIVERAEMDDFVRTFADAHSESEEVDYTEYIRTKETQEEIRDAETMARLREDMEREINKKPRVTAAQARGELIRSVVKVPGAAVSAAAAPLSVATGITAAGLVAGATGKTDVQTLVSYADAGMALEGFVEKGIPGTLPANSSKKSWGSQIDNAIKETAARTGLSYEEVSNEMMARQRKNNGIKARNEAYTRNLRNP